MPVLRPQRLTQRVVLMFGVLLVGTMLLGAYYFPWSPRSHGQRQKKKNPYQIVQADLVQYLDVDDYINEDGIREIFLPNSQAATPVTSRRQHSLGELQDLINAIDTTTLPPVTAILPYHTPIDTLVSQLAALHTQSVVPYSIWIICETEDEKHFVEKQNFPYHNVHIFFRDDKMMPLPSTEYIWVLDLGVVPGPRHLELVLKLNETPEYRNTLVAAAATVRIGWAKNKVECHPAKTASKTTTPTQMIGNACLLRHQWLDAADLKSKPGNAPLGYWISRNLGAGGQDIPLISLPEETKTNKDYALKGMSDKDECAMLGDYFKNIDSLSLEDKIMLAEEDVSPETETVVFLVGEDTTESEWVQLACGMHIDPKDINPDIHIATLSETIKCPLFPATRIHNISARLQRMSNSSDDVYLAELVRQLTQLFTTVDARVFIYVQDGGITHQAVDIVRSIVGDTRVMIGLPRESLPHIGWLTDLPVSVLSQWHSIKIKLVITADGIDSVSFNRLYDSIQNAQLLNDKVDLMVYMESNTTSRTQGLVDHAIWTHGTKDIRHRIVPVERASMFVEAWYPATNDEYAIILDDGLEVSPLFYIWAKYAILKYRYTMPRHNHLYGISLSTPRILDTPEKGRQRFVPPSDTNGAPFLMQTPPSLGGGAIYFPEHWREFHDYMNARVADHVGFQLQKVEVPNLTSRHWTHSWRRYMDELVYLRGNVMLYPNFGDHASFVTRNKLFNHGKKNATAMDTFVLPFYTVPLISNSTSFTDALPNYQRLPDFPQLKVFDLWGKPTRSIDVLVKRGHDFQKIVSVCTPPAEYLFDPADLLCPFARVVQVPIGEEKEPLPTKTITLYVPAHTID